MQKRCRMPGNSRGQVRSRMIKRAMAEIYREPEQNPMGIICSRAQQMEILILAMAEDINVLFPMPMQ